MNVLLIVSAPESTKLSDNSATVQSERIQNAVRGLATIVSVSRWSLIVAEHPDIVRAIAVHLRPSLLHVTQRGAEPVLAKVSLAVLIGGGDEEIALARRVRNARIRVIPVASTGLAPTELLVEMESNDEISPSDAKALLTDTDYFLLFFRLLSP